MCIGYITMRKGEKTTHIEPGTIGIVYVEDYTSFVGLTVPHNDIYTSTEYGAFRNTPEDFVTCLVLGWFTSSHAIPQADVMGHQEMHPFPSFHVEFSDRVIWYDFSDEIRLCMQQAAQWKKMRTGITTNLIARNFFPQNSRALLLIHMAQHLMRGEGQEGRPDWHYWSPGSEFLHLWAVLRCIFPEKVIQPPEQYRDDSSNAYDCIVWSDDPRQIQVKVGFD